MASLMYNLAKTRIADGTIDLDTDTIKIMLVNSTYTPNVDHDFVDEAGANDPIDAEISVTGYTGGFGGAGRKTLTVSVTEDDTNDRAVVDAPNVTWTALGSGDTVVGAIIIKENTNDADSNLIFYIDFTDTATNGGDFTVAFDSVGIATFS